MQQPKKKLLDIVRDKIRFKHYSLSTERTYIHWIKHYIFFHNKKHPIEMGERRYRSIFNLSCCAEKSLAYNTESSISSDTISL